MRYTKDDYKEFLEAEYDAQMRSYARLVETKALVLKERGSVFVARFLKFNADIAVFKIRMAENRPRKNSFWTASVFSGDMGAYKNWGDLSWADLRGNYQSEFSAKALCAWKGKSEDSQFCLLGIKGLTVGFAKVLEKTKPVVAFGPDVPPTKYLLNLLDLSKEDNPLTRGLFGYSQHHNSLWSPQIITSKQDLNETLIDCLKKSDGVVIQGPPGTGKTFRMARLAAQLLGQRCSVLVTALTNRALMELASKEDLASFLKVGKVTKTNLTVDEHKELPDLLSNEDNKCNAASGNLSLSTFYISSGWAKEFKDDIPFDYVIMDEASQAMFPMIAAIRKLGKKVIWVGDQAQLAPIVSTNADLIAEKGWSGIVRGFEALCDNFTYPSYMLSDTFRLTERGARQTGIFYNGNLKSVAPKTSVSTDIPGLNQEGGASFVGLDIKWGDKAPQPALNKIFDIAQSILTRNPKAEIAILSKFIETTKALQNHFLNRRTDEVPKNLIIETVDKVQGLTVDYTLFLIPKASIEYSVEKELFNVATSRARFCTVIVSDKSLLRENMPQEVRRFLLQTEGEKCAAFKESQPLQRISAGELGVTVLGKIDLPKQSLREIVEGKENIFVIDTNVFVKCPTIISKIGSYKVVVPTTVLEELDHLKLKPNVDKKALSDAAKNINAAFQNQYSHLEAGDSSLLPAGFDSKKADCLILSVALKYKDEGKNAILLTSDQLLQSKALGLGLTTISLSEFIKERKY